MTLFTIQIYIEADFVVYFKKGVTKKLTNYLITGFLHHRPVNWKQLYHNRRKAKQFGREESSRMFKTKYF